MVGMVRWPGGEKGSPLGGKRGKGVFFGYGHAKCVTVGYELIREINKLYKAVLLDTGTTPTSGVCVRPEVPNNRSGPSRSDAVKEGPPPTSADGECSTAALTDPICTGRWQTTFIPGFPHAQPGRVVYC